MTAMSRQLRRSLERRTDALLSRVLPRLSGVPLPASTENTVVIAREGGSIQVMTRFEAEIALRLANAADLLPAIEEGRGRTAEHPVALVLMLDSGWASVTFTDVMPLTRGGAA